MKEFFTPQELAQYLKMNTRTLMWKARKGEIPAIKIGRQFRFDGEQIEKWLSHQKVGGKLYILVVDDDPVVGQLFAESLEVDGHKVTTTLSSLKALELINNKHFDMIFLDLLMPELDGGELFRRIRQTDKDVPVIIITGYPDSDLMVKAMEYGPFAVMKKPFTGDEILEAVHRYRRNINVKT